MIIKNTSEVHITFRVWLDIDTEPVFFDYDTIEEAMRMFFELEDQEYGAYIKVIRS